MMNKIISGGFFSNRRNQIMTLVGIMSAVCAYMVGDSDIFTMVQTLIAIGGIYLLHKSKQNKGK